MDDYDNNKGENVKYWRKIIINKGKAIKNNNLKKG